MRFQLKRIALAVALAALAAETASAANVQDTSKITTLLDRWETAANPQGADSAVWRDMMRIQLEQASPAALDKLLAVGANAKRQSMGEYYKTFINTLGSDIQARLDAQKPRKTVAADSAGDEPAGKRSLVAPDGKVQATKTLGSASNDQVFTPITPCRVVDTRNLGGPIGPFATRNFFYFTTSSSTNWNSIQGGVNGAAGTVCPGTVVTGYNPSSAVATITVTGQGGNGNLIVWQGTSPVASASTMSYPGSGDTSSLATIPWGGRSGTGPGGSVEDFGVFVNAFTATNVVVDIVGYYTAPAATALDCNTQVVHGPGTADVANNTSKFLAAPSCAAGFSVVANACHYDGANVAGLYLQEVSVFFGDCYFFNATGSAKNSDDMAAEVRCCRVPGH